LQEYEKFREADDFANAIPCFNRYSELLYDSLLTLPDFDRAQRSIISSFQPKSGGTFLHNRMLQLGYKEYWWCVVDRRCATVCYAMDEALQRYLSGGCTTHCHALPHPNILAALDRAHVDQIWVHLRNPAATIVAAYHHYGGEGQGQGQVGEDRRKEAIAEARRIGIDPQADKNQFVIEHVDETIDWVERWLRYAQERPGKLVFSYYRELADLTSMLPRVFGELGVELRGSVSVGPHPDDRYRKKEANDWRHGLSPEAQRHLEQRVRAKLGDFPEFESLWN
jgi:hypothetical protein